MVYVVVAAIVLLLVLAAMACIARYRQLQDPHRYDRIIDSFRQGDEPGSRRDA